MKSPTTVDDLQFASELRALPDGDGHGGLEIDGDYDRVLFAGFAASGRRRRRRAVHRVRVHRGTGFDGGRLRRARLSDVWFGETRLVAVDLAESSLTDVWFSGCVFAGVQAFSCVGRRVLFRGCKLDSVNFRDCKLTDVDLRGLRAARRRLRLGEARQGAVHREHARRHRLHPCRSARTSTCAARGSAPRTRRGSRPATTACGGTRIDSLQLMTLAPLLAHHLGITVTD